MRFESSREEVSGYGAWQSKLGVRVKTAAKGRYRTPVSTRTENTELGGLNYEGRCHYSRY